MRIIDEEGDYWVEDKSIFLRCGGYWSNKKYIYYKDEKIDFFILKAIFIFSLMRLSGVKARMVRI